MAVIKVVDMAYARVAAPDLDVAERFLVDFGLTISARTDRAIYARGTDSPHHVYIAEKGDPRFLGFAYYAASRDDLDRLAKEPGASAVEPINEPGGGMRVRLREPNGYEIEVVYGIEELASIPVQPRPVNSGWEPLARAGDLMRLGGGPSRVKRIGHGVMGTPKLRETLQWFSDNLGFISSDAVYAGEEDNMIAAFYRLDRGDEYVDHHTFFAFDHPTAGLQHISFEVHDIDDVFKGHEYLEGHKYEHMWGIGRHLLGSQVFDYWADPWGRIHEHWADSDRLNLANGSNVSPVEVGFNSQWGGPPPDKLLARVLP
jgi:catechol 2,3-dioxygenase-like lactoylglutathione lyase family enzyme